MKNKIQTVCLAAVISAGLIQVASAQQGYNAWSLGLRYHTEHSTFEELPFDKGDLSGVLAYEYHESEAYWQLALAYAWDPSGIGEDLLEPDYVLTPQINLILKDGIWRGGVGALKSYTKFEDGSSDSTSVYWQLMLGISLPAMAGFDISAGAFYTFDRWTNLSDFSTKDLEYGAKLSYRFK